MPGEVVAILVATAVVLGLLVVAALYYSRIRTLSQRVGSFECLLRPDAARPWSAGIAQYGAGRLDWWRLSSLSLRPAHTWPRAELAVLGRELPADDGAREPGCVVHCRIAGHDFDVLVSAEAYAGLRSWIEASPPARESRAL